MVLAGRLSIREEESPKLLVEQVTPLNQWDGKQSFPAARQTGFAARNRERRETAAPAAPAQTPLTDAQRAAQAARKLYIQLSRPDIDRAMAMLALHPGDVPVYLHIPEEKMTFLTPATAWCDLSAGCLTRLTDAFGEANVKTVEKK